VVLRVKGIINLECDFPVRCNRKNNRGTSRDKVFVFQFYSGKERKVFSYMFAHL